MLAVAMHAPSGTLKLRDLRRRFDRAAAEFDSADFVHRRTAAGLMQRLEPILIEPTRIVDLGGATGSASRLLSKRFRRSRIVLVDSSYKMLRRARDKRNWWSSVSAIQGDATAVPLRAGSVDLVFANLLLPWIDEAPAMFAEVSRVLRRGGLFVFSSLGQTSLSELREAWAAVDRDQHVHSFADMHDVGDELLRSGLREPVLDTEYLNVSYAKVATLYRDLTLVGGRNSLSGRRGTLTGKERFRNMQRQLEQLFRGGSLQLRLELVFGHAWGGGPPPSDGEYRVDASRIERRQ
jgi:malonyl-CoA O-methyltransferase